VGILDFEILEIVDIGDMRRTEIQGGDHQVQHADGMEFMAIIQLDLGRRNCRSSYPFPGAVDKFEPATRMPFDRPAGAWSPQNTELQQARAVVGAGAAIVPVPEPTFCRRSL